MSTHGQVRRSGVVGVLTSLVLLVSLGSAGALPAGAGDRVAYAKNQRLRVMDVDGTHDRQIGDGFERVTAANISPNGNKIAFISDEGGGYERLMIANLDGSNAKNISKGTDFEQTVTWNADGSRIGFTRYHAPTGETQFFTVMPNGEKERRVTDSTTYSVYSPVFSPKADKVIYSRKDSVNEYDLCLMKADGTFIRCLAETDAF